MEEEEDPFNNPVFRIESFPENLQVEKYPLYQNIKWDVTDVFTLAAIMLQKAFNPLRLLSSELELYIGLGKIVEGPLLEMELHLKLKEIQQALLPFQENDYKSRSTILAIQPILKRQTFNKLPKVNVVIDESNRQNKPKLPEVEVIDESNPQKKLKLAPLRPKVYKTDKETKLTRKFLALQGYALFYETMSTYLPKIYKLYIYNVLNSYLTKEKTELLVSSIEDYLLNLEYFRAKYYARIGGVDGIKGFFKKGDEKKESVSPIQLNEDKLLAYVFVGNKWIKIYDIPNLVIPLTTTANVPPPPKLSQLEIDAMDQIELPNQEGVEKQSFDGESIKGDDDDNLLGYKSDICLKCLKSCE
jgi:hypothetical protein